MSVQRLLQRAIGLAIGLSAGLAYACPVCFSAKDEAQRQAFFDTTIFLTLLPVAMISGIAYWIARRSRELAVEAEQPALAADQPAADRPAPAGLPNVATR